MKKINPMRYKNRDYYFVQYWNVAIIKYFSLFYTGNIQYKRIEKYILEDFY